MGVGIVRPYKRALYRVQVWVLLLGLIRGHCMGVGIVGPYKRALYGCRYCWAL